MAEVHEDLCATFLHAGPSLVIGVPLHSATLRGCWSGTSPPGAQAEVAASTASTAPSRASTLLALT